MSETYTSNRLETLLGKLAENIQKPKTNLFAKEVVITQSAGMNAWLKTELAKRNRVFANFEFQNQDGFYAKMHLLLFKSLLPNNSDTIKYKIYNVLGSADFQEKFAEVAAYYKESELRRFQLSAKIADLCDQYQLYRSDIIDKWEKGELCTGNPAEIWQQYLWTELNIESRARIKAKMIEEFKSQKELIQKTYPEISLFGISVFTDFHLDFFKQLAQYTQVNFYLCHPTDKIEYRNELLLSYGSKALELAEMIPIEGFMGIENNEDTLLAGIQNRILHNETNFEGRDDGSVIINSCFTPVREAECLYNYLLDLFEKDSSLKPQEVLVMTTDINKYAPFIKAVFKNAPVKIPYWISGAANNSDDSMVSALEMILKFCEEDLTSEKVISLLEQKRIKQRFGINDCNYLRSMVKKANIRFGRENRVADETIYVSWKYGLEKILLGYCMLTDEEYTISNDLTVFPFKDMEGTGAHDLFKLKAFLETLEAVIDEQKNAKTLAEWKLFLFENVIDKMIFHNDFEKKDREEINSIYRALSFADNPLLSDNIPFAVFLEELKKRLFTESRESKLNTGRVTVSSPIPVRGIPFKVICFLGLNNDVFPRKDSFMGFDLLGEEYRKGDRGKKETDKYLFLDTILAAREKLYLSYIGRSVKENAEIPASIVVDTLLDYVNLEEVLVTHPLHGFSTQYQKENKRLFTYLFANEGQDRDDFKSRDLNQSEFSEISVDSLVKFFEHPIEWYFNNILGIKYSDNNDALPENELFDLVDYLQKFIVKKEILKLDAADNENYLKKGIMEGMLPLKNTGKLTFENLIEEIAELRAQYQARVREKNDQPRLISINISEIKISGVIDSVFDNEFIAYSFSDNLKYRVRAYIKSLLLCAASEIGSSVFLDKKGNLTELPLLKKEDAIIKLEQLIAYFKKGILSPLKFTIDATKPPANSQLSIETVLESIKKESLGNPNAKPPIGPNRYLETLIEEKYFEEFNDCDFEELKTLAGLLNLNNP